MKLCQSLDTWPLASVKMMARSSTCCGAVTVHPLCRARGRDREDEILAARSRTRLALGARPPQPPPTTEVRGEPVKVQFMFDFGSPNAYLAEQVIKASYRIWRPARRDLKLVNFCRSFTAGPQASRWQGRGGEFDTRAGGQLGALWHYGQRACALVFPIEDDERCNCCRGRRKIGRRCIVASYWRRRGFEGRGGIRASPAQMRARERPLRCSVEGEQQGTLTFTQRISLIAVYESSGRDDQPADHRICIRRAPGSRARAACPICRRRNAARMLGSNPLRLNDFTMGQQRSNTRVGSRPSVASCSSET